MNKKLLQERFWNNITPADENTCWKWKGNINSNGYGRISIKKKHIYAHRASWIIHFGCIPKGLHVLHHCDNPSCVNPDHLFIGTNLDNIKDKVKKRRQSVGEERPASKLNNDLVRRIRYLFHEKGYSNKELSKLFGVSRSQISDVSHYKSWRHVT